MSNKNEAPSSARQREPSILPEGWIRRQSRNRPDKWYYFNKNTGESSWYKPSGGGGGGQSASSNKVSECQREIILVSEMDNIFIASFKVWHMQFFCTQTIIHWECISE